MTTFPQLKKKQSSKYGGHFFNLLKKNNLTSLRPSIALSGQSLYLPKVKISSNVAANLKAPNINTVCCNTSKSKPTTM